MLTPGEDVEIHALAQRGWSISAIARGGGEAADEDRPVRPRRNGIDRHGD
jgi:hypothetical protein